MAMGYALLRRSEMQWHRTLYRGISRVTKVREVSCDTHECTASASKLAASKPGPTAGAGVGVEFLLFEADISWLSIFIFRLWIPCAAS